MPLDLGGLVSPLSTTSSPLVDMNGIPRSPLYSSNMKDMPGLPDDYDPYWDSVVLLLNMDKMDYTTSPFPTIDQSKYKRSLSRAVAGGGDATKLVLSPNRSKFGTTSLFTSNWAMLQTAPDNGIFNPSATVDLTIEAWLNLTAFTGNGWNGVVSNVNGAISGWRMLINDNGQYHMSQVGGVGGPATGAGFITLNRWYFLTFVCKSSVGYLFCDGKLLVPPAPWMPASSPQVLMIGNQDPSSSWALTGYIGPIRITKAARYTSDFIVPSGPFPTK